MMTASIFELFAHILDYPEEHPCRAVEGCISALGREGAEAAALLGSFQAAVESMDLGELQETYTGAFDMVPDFSLNLGYQLFGDDWRRSTLMSELSERYRGRGLKTGNELPDHLCLILRFLAIEEGSERERLMNECLVPALTRLSNGIDREGNPYGTVLEALLTWLKSPVVKGGAAVGGQSSRS